MSSLAAEQDTQQKLSSRTEASSKVGCIGSYVIGVVMWPELPKHHIYLYSIDFHVLLSASTVHIHHLHLSQKS